jgi:two-component system CheB/CheR fusion protein
VVYHAAVAVPPRRILIVDDNPDAVAVLAIALKRAGHETHHAGDGRTGLALVRTLRPDIVVLDIGLPEVDGFEVARQIRCDPALSATRIIALTGSGRQDDREAAREAGIDQVLLKPIDLAFLESLLGRAP